MPNNVISKTAMRGFLEHLSASHTLIGPVDTGKVIEYRKAAPSDILMDDRVSYKSIKEYYFPQVERMFTFVGGEVEENTDIPSCAIFGARPCDLEALRVMDKVYTTGKYADPFFQRRAQANLLIGVGCTDQKPGCFCQDMGIDQEFSDFCDIMLIDAGENYTVEYLSEKGSQALKSYPATESVDCENTRKASEAETKIALNTQAEDAAYFDIIDWAKATETCLGCGMCTYICPTCHCFDFKDVAEKSEAARYKCWDSCMYPKFTLHASGHNPRENRHERYRQRVLHKYKYVPRIFGGQAACTGCGRCVRSCPAGIDIKNIAKQVMEVQP